MQIYLKMSEKMLYYTMLVNPEAGLPRYIIRVLSRERYLLACTVFIV